MCGRYKKVEKTTKSCSEILNFFSPIAAQTAQTEELIFQNVAYRPTGPSCAQSSDQTNKQSYRRI